MIDAVAWTLVHFLWQGALVWILVSMQLRFVSQARVRYAVGCSAMLLMLALPLATLLVLARDTTPAAELREFLPSTTSVIRAAIPTEARETAWMPLVVALWASGVVLFSLRNAGGLALAYVWRRRALTEVPAEYREAACSLALRLGLRRPVRLRRTAAGIAPSVSGWLNPVIVLPAVALGLPFEQVEALLAHELAHVRRLDFVVNLLQTAVETLLFYHPAVWWLGRRIREERENCCDDLAVAVCGNRVVYAQALSSLAELRDRVPNVAIAAAGGSLVRRIARLLGVSQPENRAMSTWLVAIIAVCGIVVFAGAASVAGAGKKLQKDSTGSVAAPVEIPAERQAPSSPDVVQSPIAQAQARVQQPQSSPGAPTSVEPGGTYIGKLAELGFTDLSVADLIAFKVQGVTPEYVRSWQDAGFKPAADDLVAMRIHGVTPEYAQALKAAGLADLTVDHLVAARIHGVNPDSVRQLNAAGLGALTFDDIIAGRIHGLTPEYVRSLKDAGFPALNFDQAIQARIHGLELDTIRELRELGLGNLDFDDVITARIRGITPAFVRRVKELGLKDLTLDKIVALKTHNILD